MFSVANAQILNKKTSRLATLLLSLSIDKPSLNLSTTYLLIRCRPGDGSGVFIQFLPLAEVDDCIDETVTANVTSATRVVTVAVGLLGDVETSNERPHRLAPFADLDKHVAVNLRQRVSAVGNIC